MNFPKQTDDRISNANHLKSLNTVETKRTRLKKNDNSYHLESTDETSRKTRYPSFSHVKCKIPSHIIKPKSTHVIVKQKPLNYPTFAHVKHRIDDKNLLNRPGPNRLKETYVRLQSFSHVKSTIPEGKVDLKLKHKRLHTKDQNSNTKKSSATNSRNKKTNTLDRRRSQNDRTLEECSSISKKSNDINKPDLLIKEENSNKSTTQENESVTNNPVKNKCHLLSEIQRKRIVAVFKGGSKLLTFPLPFLLILTNYD